LANAFLRKASWKHFLIPRGLNMTENEKAAKTSVEGSYRLGKAGKETNPAFLILGILCWGYVALSFLLFGLVAINLINAIPFFVGLYFISNRKWRIKSQSPRRG
jgi:hypothetical protein